MIGSMQINKKKNQVIHCSFSHCKVGVDICEGQSSTVAKSMSNNSGSPGSNSAFVMNSLGSLRQQNNIPEELENTM